MSKPTPAWQNSELRQIDADKMDIERIKHLIANIDNNIKSSHSPHDSKKLRNLKDFFEQELRRRGRKTFVKSA